MKWHEMIHKMTWYAVQCMKYAMCVKYKMRDMRDMRAMHAMCTMKWREMMHEMTCDMQCMRCRSFISVTCNEVQPWIFDFGYMQRDVTLNFLSLIVDYDHNLIILFLISLRILSIGVDVKLTQQDVKNPRLQWYMI